MSKKSFLTAATLASAVVSVVALGLLYAFGVQSDCDGPCPKTPVTADGEMVSDRFWFRHRDLGPAGSITVRLTSMTGTITYPPPNHDQIVPGLTPWAKVGVIVKDGVHPGSAYAALVLTGSHGVRFQYAYTGDVAGSTTASSSASQQSPRWLRLTRDGDKIEGYESADGTDWRLVGRTTLAGLPATAQVGLLATSPGDLTLREIGLGGAIEELRFTQAVGVFDHVTTEGAGGDWQSGSVGEMNHTDWEKLHVASGATEHDGVVTIAGTGDVGPISEDSGITADRVLAGVLIALIILLVIGGRRGARTAREQRDVLRGAVRTGLTAFATALVAVGVTVPVSLAILAAKDVPVDQLPLLTGVRVVVGLALVLGLATVFAYALGVVLRRAWLAIVVSLALIALPYAITVVPFLPDEVAAWLLRLTPAAGFAVRQTATEYAQVTAHYTPANGYYPLPGWAGLAVLCAYTLIVMIVALRKRTSELSWR
ncbi:MAG: hypothetical protein HOV77_02645 [Hamadaea sp.]|uniref:hypothetical protein n=1 Tax=Hamadaea sp. TaxID=2024425 RepID=UPI0018489145|nr:hypothetical protein [Hamadaea sp.]NUT18057.1 hypothetical protein [Hamadaea sp.]